MKKCLFIFLLCPLITFAQWDEDRRFIAHVIAGFNASQVDGDQVAGFNKFGANVGVGSYIMFIPKFSMSIELLYSQKGSKQDLRGAPKNQEKAIILDYVEVPFMFNFHDKQKAIFSGGFSFARSVRYKEYEEGTEITDDLADNYNKFDYSGILAVTFLIKKRYGINLRWSYSMRKLGEFPDSNLSNLGRYNNTLSLRAMYVF